MKVISKYSIEDRILISSYINKQNKARSNAWVQLYSYFIYINCFAFSAFLFFLLYLTAGLALFLVNLFFILFLGDKIPKESYREYYRNFFIDSEYIETEVELLESGVGFTSVDGESFFLLA